jgi:hypothetical protein
MVVGCVYRNNTFPLVLWDLVAGQEILALPHRETVVNVSISPDKRSALSAGPSVISWDLRSGEKIKTLPVQREATHVTFVSDSTALSASNDYIIRHWDLGTGKPIARINHQMTSLHVSEGGSVFAIASNQAFKMWDLRTHEIIAAYSVSPTLITSTAATLDLSSVAYSCTTDSAFVLKVNDPSSSSSFSSSPSSSSSSSSTPVPAPVLIPTQTL